MSHLLPLGGDGVDLVDEDDGSVVRLGIGLGVLEGATEIGFGFSCDEEVRSSELEDV